MKKILKLMIIGLLICLLAFSALACGSSEDNTDNNSNNSGNNALIDGDNSNTENDNNDIVNGDNSDPENDNNDIADEGDGNINDEENSDNVGDNEESNDTSSDLYITIKNIAIDNGVYSDGEYKYKYKETDNFIYELIYDTTDKIITFQVYYSASNSSCSDLFCLNIDEVDGIYKWSYLYSETSSGLYDYLSGNIYANSWEKDSSLIVSNNRINTSKTLASLKNLAKTSLNSLLSSIDNNFALYEITTYKLGFTKYASSSSSSTTDIFTVTKNYIVNNGVYEDGEYQVTIDSYYSSDYTTYYKHYLSYDTTDQVISLSLFSKSSSLSCLTSIDIDNVDGIYDWSYVDSLENYMSGTLYASIWTSNSVLTYTYKNIYDTSLITSVKNLASSSIDLILLKLNNKLSSNGITAYKLGFTNFN